MLKSNEATETGTFDSLFDDIIRCPYLKQFYSRKRLDYDSEGEKLLPEWDYIMNVDAFQHTARKAIISIFL